MFLRQSNYKLLNRCLPLLKATSRSFSEAYILNTRHIIMSAKESPDKAKLLRVYTPKDQDDCSWVALQKIDYLDPNGNQNDWEMAVRKTRSVGTNTDSDSVDAVMIIALLKHPEQPLKVLLQKQFRPPVGAVSIEMPAGMIDPRESVATSAVRELKEETGYSGTIIDTSPIIFTDPGFTNTTMAMVTIEVDMTLPENQNPVPELEEDEFIETFAVELDQLHEELLKLYKQGYKLDSRVQNIAIGLKMAQMYKPFA